MKDFYEKRNEINKEAKSKHFCWHKGRQIGDYEVMILCRNAFIKFDAYFIRYKEGAYIPPHVDPVKTGKHYRLNMILWKANKGGDYVGDYVWKWWRFILFRPDIHTHSVTKVESGVRFLFSIGWIRK